MIDFKRAPSPCFLLDERLLARNLSVVDRVRRESGAEVIVALKACAMWSIFPLLARHSDGATASSAAEARLVREEFGQPAHTYAPVYTDRNIGEILDCSSHITFNSLGQFRRFGAMALLRGISCGLRVNPRYSPVETDLYNPCVAGSRLGVTAEELEAQGVQFNLGEQVRSFPGRTFVEQVQTNRGTYPCDLCVVAIGVTPNTGLLAGTGAQLAPNGAVLIGADFATSVPNIYAVGDCAACRDGSLRTSSLKVADLEIARTGLTETEARKAGLRVKSAMATGTDRPGICPNPHRITIKLVYEANTRQVLGAQAWGEKNVSARINAIAVAIRAGMTVEALGQVDFVYSSSSCSIWDPVQIVCGQAQ